MRAFTLFLLLFHATLAFAQPTSQPTTRPIQPFGTYPLADVRMRGGPGNDVLNGVIKSFIFGVAVTFIALYQGYQAKPTPEGVSRATTRTVVIASLAVLALDFLLTALMFS